MGCILTVDMIAIMEFILKTNKMTAKDFVLSKYPEAFSFPMIDNKRDQTSYVILKGRNHGLEYITNEGARTSSKAWTDAKKFILNQNK